MDKIIAFVGGLAVGVVSSYLVLSNYFEKREDEERKFLIAHYEKKLETAAKAAKAAEQKGDEVAEETVNDQQTNERPPADVGIIMEGHRSVENYRNYSGMYKRSNVGMPMYEEDHPDDDDDNAPPRPISPTDLNKHVGYAQIILRYFTEDGVLADDSGNVYDVASTIGPDGLQSIGKYEADTGYITDEAIRVDYIIERVENSYEDAFVFR